MLIAHYRHRLPADYDMDRIRERIAARGAAWDATPGLGFKAFAAGDRKKGAAHNTYASLYLWLDLSEAVGMLTDDRFAAVIGTFGRPGIATWLPFDLRFGAADDARFLTREDVLLGPDHDLAACRRAEAARGREVAQEPDVFASIVGLDPGAWRLTRFTLRRNEPSDPTALEVLHLARPGISILRDRSV